MPEAGFLLINFQCSQSGNHSQNNLAKFWLIKTHQTRHALENLLEVKTKHHLPCLQKFA